MGRREQNKADKRERLLAAGLHAFVEEGYSTASVERIAADAGVARGTFYLYFHDKEALFAALMEGFSAPMGATLAEARVELAACPDPESTYPVYAALGLRLAMLLAERVGEVRLYFAESRSPGPVGDAVRACAASIVAHTEDILDDAVTLGVLRPHDTHVVAVAIVGGVERLVEAWLAGDTRLDPARVPAEVTALFRRGLAPAIG
ncbi:MAG: helix-turn-helix domain-containing protein [Pseudomonadota bacterium]|nr:helix-turn-helix domain-containing protein [Pseudomonadota bacterium]